VTYSGTVVVPYEWVRIVGSCLLPTFVLSMMSWEKECGSHSFFLFCSQSPSI
jgi:hypothetical protein